MLRIPSGQVLEGDLDQAVGLRGLALEGDEFLTDLIISKVRQDVDPECIVETTEPKTTSCQQP